ncbi:hypothetical protein AVEN_264890-1 [Araneus ventricosus]|uniref:Uncharacterized protein n=1 Tax=Araneus ventricosus TaxID=182803 RepID=A0A4Y2IPZ0_ARAVE|nr:hypothetical protein AVEN_264890-1 [Araneus ventricosus]
MTPLFVESLHYSVNYLVDKFGLKMDDEQIKQTGQILKLMTFEFEEKIKRRLANSEKVVSDISRLLFWPLVVVIVLALIFPIYYQVT